MNNYTELIDLINCLKKFHLNRKTLKSPIVFYHKILIEELQAFKVYDLSLLSLIVFDTINVVYDL